MEKNNLEKEMDDFSAFVLKNANIELGRADPYKIEYLAQKFFFEQNSKKLNDSVVNTIKNIPADEKVGIFKKILSSEANRFINVILMITATFFVSYGYGKLSNFKKDKLELQKEILHQEELISSNAKILQSQENKSNTIKSQIDDENKKLDEIKQSNQQAAIYWQDRVQKFRNKVKTWEYNHDIDDEFPKL